MRTVLSYLFFGECALCQECGEEISHVRERRRNRFVPIVFYAHLIELCNSSSPICFTFRGRLTRPHRIRIEPRLAMSRVTTSPLIGTIMLRLTSFGVGDHAAYSACSWPLLLALAAVLGPWHLLLAPAPGPCPWHRPLALARGPDPWPLPLAPVPCSCPWPSASSRWGLEQIA